MFVSLRRHLLRSEGASAVEYAILLAAIAVVITFAVFTLGSRVKSVFTDTNSCIVAKGQNCAEAEGDSHPAPSPSRTRHGGGH